MKTKLGSSKVEKITALKQRIKRAQRLVHSHVKPGTSLVDELIADRRRASANK